MARYLKSELYRILHGKAIYITTFCYGVGTVLLNLLLWSIGAADEVFPYDNFRFSLNVYTDSPYLTILMAAVVCGLLFSDDHKNGVIRNTISFGITRLQIFFGRTLITFVLAIAMTLTILVFYVGSAYILLDNPEWLPLQELFMSIVAMLPNALGSIMLLVLVKFFATKELFAYMFWAAVYYGIPALFSVLIFRFDFLVGVVNWLPKCFVITEVNVSMSGYDCLWDTPEGLAKCFVSGAIAIAIYTISAIIVLRKKDV